jgi:hypothetical protein
MVIPKHQAYEGESQFRDTSISENTVCTKAEHVQLSRQGRRVLDAPHRSI